MDKWIEQAWILLALVVVSGCSERTDKSTESSERAGLPEGRSQVAAIRLVGVAEPLSLPAPKGANRILTAKITGGTATSVWLADSAASSPRVPLVPVGDGEYQVNLYSEEVREALKENPDGQFNVFAEFTDSSLASSIPVRYTIEVPPACLVFPWDKATMTIYQRTTKEIPGSDGHLRLRLGDITAGHVLVSVTGPDRQSVVEMQPMREGEAIPLSLEQTRYILVLEDLVNLFTGRDYAVFCVMPEVAWERENIDRLLKVIESADVAFIREGEEMTGVAFAARLRLKLEFAEPEVASLDEFVDQIASRSWTSGKPYQVKLETGDIIEAADWLRRKAKEISTRAEDTESGHNVPASGPAGTTSAAPPWQSREHAHGTATGRNGRPSSGRCSLRVVEVECRHG